MRVVVVGASGNVGTSVLQALAQEPAVSSILAVARRTPESPWPKTTWAPADVETDPLMALFKGADAVVHLAWLIQPSHDPVKTWRTNVLGSIRVFEAVADAQVPALVYASSVGAYSPGPKDTPVDESWPTHGWPTAAYCREKAYVERYLDSFEQQHPELRIVRLRPGFIFKRESASEQRRLFAGPLLPRAIVRPRLIPAIPDVRGLRLQALHADDAAQAYRLAVTRPVRGAFNIAAEPVLDAQSLAAVLDAKVVRLPAAVLRMPLAAAWHLHLTPASPYLVDAVLQLPIMDTTRARTELGWTPEYDAQAAVRELLDGMREGAGMATPPLTPKAGGTLRHKEFSSGVGQKP